MLVFFLCSEYLQANSSETISNIHTINNQILELKEEIIVDDEERSRLVDILRHSENRISKLQKDIRIKNTAIQKTEKSLAEIQQNELKLRIKQDALLDKISQIFRYIWKNRQQSALQVLLSNEDQAKLSRDLVFFRYVLSHQVNAIKDFENGLKQLANNKSDLEKSRKLLSSRRKDLKKTQLSLNRMSKARGNVIAKLSAAINDREKQIKVLIEDRSLLQALIEQVTKSEDIIGDTSFLNLKGKMPWPLDGEKGNYFGMPRNEGKMRWQGVTIFAEEGKTVSAIHYGRVVFSDWLRGLGLLTIIDHGDGYMTLYAHNSSLLKKSGDWVAPGMQIATVGRSGRLDKPSLYFEIRHNGRPTDPNIWCEN